MGIKIREANDKDLLVLKKFQNKLVEFEMPFDETIKKGTKGYYQVKRWMHSSKSKFMVAEVRGKLAGCGFGRIKEDDSWSINTHIGHIGLLFVEKEHRGKGIGKLIVNELIKWFKKKKIKDVRLQVYAKNVNAIKAYKKLGFENRIIELKKPIL